MTYDVLLERYEKMTVGEVKTSLDDSIRTISEEVKKEVPTATSINQAISLAANILTGSRGGNVLINTNANGQPVEILVMDTDDITTASNILRINRDGMAVTSEGYKMITEKLRCLFMRLSIYFSYFPNQFVFCI